MSDKQQAFDEMRKVTAWTGQVFDAQVQTIKMVSMLLLESHVSISLNTIEKVIEVSSSKPVSEQAQTRMRQMVDSVLTPEWKLNLWYDGGHGSKPDATGASKSKGSRGVPKVRRKRRSGSKR